MDHTEFNELKFKAMGILNTARGENRPLSESEKNTFDDISFKLQKEQEEQSEIKRIVTASFNRQSKPGYNGQPIGKADSLFAKLGMQTPAVSLGQFLRAAVIGPSNEAERFALQGSTDNTGGFEMPANVAARFIDGFRADSVYVQAGALVVPIMDRTKASRTTDPTATFRAEDASVTASAPFASVALSPQTLSVIVKVSREQLEDSINVGNELERAISSAMGKAADAAIGFGSGSGEPAGIAGTSGINAVTSATNGDQLTSYAKLLDAVYQVQTNNGNPNAVILSAREQKTISAFVDTTNQPLRKPESLASLPFLASASVPITQTQGSSSVASTILVGDFTRLLVGVRVGLRIEVLKERFADNYEYGFLASIRMDSLVTRAKSFTKITGLIP